MGHLVLTYRFRLLPTKQQHRALEAILEAQRQLYNAALLERIDAYRKAGLHRSYFDQCKALTEWRAADADANMYPVNLQRGTLWRLDVAYRSCLARAGKAKQKLGMPRFRGKGRFRSFTFRSFCGISFRAGAVRFKGIPGALRVHQHRPLPFMADIRGCTFRRDPKGWYVGFDVLVESAPPRDGTRAVGLDLGIEPLATLSTGEVIPSLKAARRAQRRIRVLQRALARKSRRSEGRRKARAALQRAYAGQHRQRKCHAHRATAMLIVRFDLLAFERLDVSGLGRGILAGPVHDAAWSMFISILRYKAEKAGTRLIEVDPRNTSQDCSGCGTRVPKPLGERWHACPKCGMSLDRDVNAARNILNRAVVGASLRNVA